MQGVIQLKPVGITSEEAYKKLVDAFEKTLKKEGIPVNDFPGSVGTVWNLDDGLEFGVWVECPDPNEECEEGEEFIVISLR